jgi:hypothetical protein
MESYEETPETAREAEPGGVPRDEDLVSEEEARAGSDPTDDPAADHRTGPEDPRRIQGSM